MKLLKLICVGLVFCTSCTQNNEELEIVQRLQKGEKRELSISNSQTNVVKNEKERIMFMTSFLVGKTLLENKEARDYFYLKIASQSITKIDLSDVLDSDKEDNPFEIAFQEQFNLYNWHISPSAGAPIPPRIPVKPNSIRWGGILSSNMYYYQYLIEILENSKLELYFPNKNTYVNELQDFSTYFENYNTLSCLWSLDYFVLFSDGLILHTNGEGNYLPENFNPNRAKSFVFILRDRTIN